MRAGAKAFGVAAPERASPKVFAPGADGQPAFAGDGRLFSNRDETRLPESSGKLGEEERCAVRSRGCFGASQSFGLRHKPVG
jgi:hypothetical protein